MAAVRMPKAPTAPALMATRIPGAALTEQVATATGKKPAQTALLMLTEPPTGLDCMRTTAATGGTVMLGTLTTESAEISTEKEAELPVLVVDTRLTREKASASMDRTLQPGRENPTDGTETATRDPGAQLSPSATG